MSHPEERGCLPRPIRSLTNGRPTATGRLNTLCARAYKTWRSQHHLFKTSFFPYTKFSKNVESSKSCDVKVTSGAHDDTCVHMGADARERGPSSLTSQ